MFRIGLINRAAFYSLIMILTLAFNAAAQQVVPLKGTLDPSDLVTLETRPGVTVSFQVVKPTSDPIAVVVLFAGDHGNLQLSQNDGFLNMKWGSGNFAIRTNGELLLEDIIAVLIDAPSDRQSKEGMLGGFRSGAEHAADVTAVVDYLKKTYKAPVWLHGTSRGTESVANSASRNIPGISGIVLSSSISKTNNSGESILQRPLDKITVPALVLAHKDDGCEKTPPEDAQNIANAMTNSPKVEVKLFEGGSKPKSGPCYARSQHGFLGIELDVLDSIVTFIKENKG